MFRCCWPALMCFGKLCELRAGYVSSWLLITLFWCGFCVVLLSLACVINSLVCIVICNFVIMFSRCCLLTWFLAGFVTLVFVVFPSFVGFVSLGL